MANHVTLGFFVSADLNRKDRAAFHNVRMGYVRHALDSALRGNASEWIAAQTAAIGKTQLARAYREAFETVPAPDRFPYKGKLTAADADQIKTQAAALADQWSAKFLEVFPLTKAEKSDEDKAAAKAKREDKADKAAIERAEELGYIKPANLGAAAMADQIIALIQSGQISGENLAAVAAAVNAAVKADKAAAQAVREARKASETQSA